MTYLNTRVYVLIGVHIKKTENVIQKTYIETGSHQINVHLGMGIML